MEQKGVTGAMNRRIITVTLNPSIDVTLMTDGLDGDKANRIIDERREAGGKGINVSRVAQAFDMKTICLCIAGEDNYSEFLHYLENEAFRYEILKTEGTVRENLMLRSDGKSIKLNRKGPPVSQVMTSAFITLMRKYIREGDIAVFGGSLPPNMPVDEYIELILSAKKAGALVAVDSDCLSLDDYRRIEPWMIKPNIHELKNIISLKDESIESVIAAASELRASGIENVLVSLGSRGLVCAGEQGTLHVDARPVDVKSTVGAGDSTVAGFIIGFLNGYTLNDCAGLAADCGTAAAMREGTQLATKALVDKLRETEAVPCV